MDIGELCAQVAESLQVARRQNATRPIEPQLKSRVPGGSVVHRLFSRLLRRHKNVILANFSETNLALIAALESLTSIWKEHLQQEIALERRIHDGILDRLVQIEILADEMSQIREDLNNLVEDLKRA